MWKASRKTAHPFRMSRAAWVKRLWTSAGGQPPQQDYRLTALHRGGNVPNTIKIDLWIWTDWHLPSGTTKSSGTAVAKPVREGSCSACPAGWCEARVSSVLQLSSSAIPKLQRTLTVTSSGAAPPGQLSRGLTAVLFRGGTPTSAQQSWPSESFEVLLLFWPAVSNKNLVANGLVSGRKILQITHTVLRKSFRRCT